MNADKQGYLGNLTDKSIPELQELLARQENILRKVKFVSSLPDKGKKVTEFRRQLLDLIDKKQRLYAESDAPQTTNLSDDVNPSRKTLQKSPLDIKPNPNIKPKSKFSAKPKDKVLTTVINEDDPVRRNVDRDVVAVVTETEVLKADKQDGVNISPQSSADSADSKTHIASDFARLRDKSHRSENKSESKSDNDAVKETVDSHKGNSCVEDTSSKISVDSVVLLEKGMESMDICANVSSLEPGELKDKILENSMKVTPYFRANSSLKIHQVQDLPDQYKWKSRQSNPITKQDTSDPQQSNPITKQDTSDPQQSNPITKQDTSESRHSTVKEESAAVPPNYKYKEAHLISLNESMQLQQAQQSHQEELQAQAAADRLAKSLKARLEPFNPEGRNMAYRSQGDQMDTDSDDEPEVEFYPNDVD